jgi:hypothetical protein
MCAHLRVAERARDPPTLHVDNHPATSIIAVKWLSLRNDVAIVPANANDGTLDNAATDL